MDEKVPRYTDVEWTNYVMSQFAENEVYDGKPTVAGLQRVLELLFGEICNSAPVRTVQVPSEDNNRSCVVEWAVSFRMRNSEYRGQKSGGDPTVQTFGDLGEANEFSVEKDFLPFTASIAATRGRARAMRNALRLNKVLSLEEVMPMPVTASEFISPTQLTCIDNMCHRLDINGVELFKRSKRFSFSGLSRVTHRDAIGLIDDLGVFQRDTKKIPSPLKGYEENWQGVLPK